MTEDSKREELIEKAAKAMFAADPPSNPHGPDSDLVFDEPYTRAYSANLRILARAALAVFEEATTPPALNLIDAAQEAFDSGEWDTPTWQDDPEARDAALRWHMRGFEAGAKFERASSPWERHSCPILPLPAGVLPIPRPHVPYGPVGIPEHVADADYLDHAAHSLEGHFEVSGSNVRATVVKLLRDTASALRAAAGVTEHHAATNAEVAR